MELFKEGKRREGREGKGSYRTHPDFYLDLPAKARSKKITPANWGPHFSIPLLPHSRGAHLKIIRHNHYADIGVFLALQV